MRLRIECTKIVLISVLMSSFYGFFASLRLGFFASLRFGFSFGSSLGVFAFLTFIVWVLKQMGSSLTVWTKDGGINLLMNFLTSNGIFRYNTIGGSRRRIYTGVGGNSSLANTLLSIIAIIARHL